MSDTTVTHPLVKGEVGPGCAKVDPIVVAMLAGALMLRAARSERSEAAAPGARHLRVRLAVLALAAGSLVVSNVLAADRIGARAKPTVRTGTVEAPIPAPSAASGGSPA